MELADWRERVVQELAGALARGAEPAPAPEQDGAAGLGGRWIAEMVLAPPRADAGQLALVTLVVLANARVLLGGAPVVADELLAVPLVPDGIRLRGRKLA
jgi:hypothetical protein